MKTFYLLLILFFPIGMVARANDQRSVSRPKIFQIGFNRCGTASLSRFFQNNNIKSIHWNRGVLASSIHENYLRGLPLIGPKYQDIVAFFDLECVHEKLYIAQLLFKELDSQYPGSKFILNTRDKKKWLKSRVSHRQGHYLEDSARVYGLSLLEMFSEWSLEWDHHHEAVLEYFKDRPGDLLIFDIEKDPISKLCDFFRPYYKLDPNQYTHQHKSAPPSEELEELFEHLWSELQRI